MKDSNLHIDTIKFSHSIYEVRLKPNRTTKLLTYLRISVKGSSPIPGLDSKILFSTDFQSDIWLKIPQSAISHNEKGKITVKYFYLLDLNPSNINKLADFLENLFPNDVEIIPIKLMYQISSKEIGEIAKRLHQIHGSDLIDNMLISKNISPIEHIMYINIKGDYWEVIFDPMDFQSIYDTVLDLEVVKRFLSQHITHEMKNWKSNE